MRAEGLEVSERPHQADVERGDSVEMAERERGLMGLELRAAVLSSLRRASAALPADIATVSSELAAVMFLLEPEEDKLLAVP